MSWVRSTEEGLTEQVGALRLALRIFQGVSGLHLHTTAPGVWSFLCQEGPDGGRAGKPPVEGAERELPLPPPRRSPPPPPPRLCWPLAHLPRPQEDRLGSPRAPPQHGTPRRHQNSSAIAPCK